MLLVARRSWDQTEVRAAAIAGFDVAAVVDG
jgi:hypothetical protein